MFLRSNFILSVILLFIHITISAQPRVEKEAIPKWVNNVDWKLSSDNYKTKGETSYLLLDWQINEITNEKTYRYVVRMNTEDGIQNNSQLSFEFDPTYQQLTINKVLIHRGAATIDKLDQTRIELYRNENSSDRLIYNKNYTALLILQDIRIGDILEYQYSYKGENPIFKDVCYDEKYLNYSDEIEQIHYRYIVPKSANVSIKTFNGAPKPQKIVYEDRIEYISNLKDRKSYFVDDDIPSWYNIYPYYEISSFQNWNDVKEWGKNLYPMDIKSPVLTSYLRKHKIDTSESKILELIDFVQNDIRYLGIENGINSHKPHIPDSVLLNRFGDCKDKAYLLALALNKIGIKAWPALVSTTYKDKLDNNIPSPFAFNHVIVKFIYKNNTYWIDATNNNQRGILKFKDTPNFGKALVIDSKKGLEEIPLPENNKIEIVEHFYCADSSITNYSVKTIYSGNLANQNRSYLYGQSIEQTKNNYLDFCSNYYDLSWQKENSLTFSDDTIHNQFTITENYMLSDFWQFDKSDSTDMYALIEAYNIYQYLNFTEDKSRTMPLDLAYPLNLDIQINVHFPKYKQLGFKNTTDSISNKYFTFIRECKNLNERHQFQIKYHYETKTNYVEIADFSQYDRDSDDLEDFCAYQMSWGITKLENTKDYNIYAIVIALLYSIILFSIIYKFLLRTDYNITSISNANNPINGLAFLIAIGLFISPLLTIYQVFNGNYFYTFAYNNVLSLSSKGDFLAKGVLYFELLFNITMIALFLYSIILFLHKRVSFPAVYIITRLIYIVGVFIDLKLAKVVLNIEEDYSDLFKTIINAAIWVPILLYSKKIKETFNKNYKPIKLFNKSNYRF